MTDLVMQHNLKRKTGLDEKRRNCKTGGKIRGMTRQTEKGVWCGTIRKAKNEVIKGFGTNKLNWMKTKKWVKYLKW